VEVKKPKTLSNAIVSHQDWIRHGEHLLSEQTKAERSEAEFYRKISEVLSRPELKNAAIVDEASRTVYHMDGIGVVRNLRLVWAGNVPLELDNQQDIGTIVSVGEAS
jgi:hypothetical protein